VARTFALIALVGRVLHQGKCSSEMVPNAPKQKETHENMSLGSNGVDRDRSLWKILTRHRGTNFALIAPVWRVLQQVLCSSKAVPKAPKWKETHQNMSLQSYGVDRKRSLQKILTRLRGMNFCINCKCSQTERKEPKHEFRVQRCGSGVFVVKEF
jgi:hypothetical protein